MGYGVLATRLLKFYVGSNSAQDLPEVGHGESIRLIFVTGNKFEALFGGVILQNH